MKNLRRKWLAPLAGVALLAFAGAGTASATTLEAGGVARNESIFLEGTLSSGTSMVQSTTSGSFQDTCTSSSLKGKTEGSFTGTVIGGKLSTLTLGNCTHGTRVVQKGNLTFERIAGTTNATVRSAGMLVEQDSTTFGTTLECTTSNTHLGTLTGTAGGHAILRVNAVINCGFFVPSAKWEGEYTFTSPTGLGAVA